MAARRRTEEPAKKQHAGRLLTSKPEKLELVKGEVYSGRLGAPKPGQYGISRTIMTDEGKFWIPNHAALDAVFSLPAGAKVELLYKGEAKNAAGKKFHDWDAWEMPEGTDNADGLPF